MGDDAERMAPHFDEHRQRLRSVALRILGSEADADDALQNAWLKVARSRTQDVSNPVGWYTTVVTRVCLDMLRSSRSRRQDPLEAAICTPAHPSPESCSRADDVHSALAIVQDRLSPAERVAFVMHDVFNLSFQELAVILGRTPETTRQLASRARRRVRGSSLPESDTDSQRVVVEAFWAAAREGDLAGLIAVLAPGVVLRADATAVNLAKANKRQGAPALTSETRGAAEVAESFKGRASAAIPAVVDDRYGAVWLTGGEVRAAFSFRVEYGVITCVEIAMETDRLSRLNVILA